MILLAHVHIVEKGIGGIARIVVVVTDQGQGIGVACRHTGRDLHPGGAIVTGLRQDGAGGIARVILERRRGPVIGHGVGTMHLVPEGECAAPTGCSEGLAEAAISIGS